MNIEYRIAEARDASALITHMREVGGETDNLSYSANTFNITPEREAKFIEKFSSGKNGVMYVAMLGTRVVGCAIVEKNKVLRYNHRAEISITVNREFWGQGIGSRLMEMMIEFASNDGIEILYLEARADNERAIALYKKYGFSQIGIYEGFFKIEKKRFDAVLMTKCLVKNK